MLKLYGMRNRVSILCTRLLDDHLLSNAGSKGIHVDTIAFIVTSPVSSPEMIQQVRSLATQEITAIFTSTNAVDAVTKHLPIKPNWAIYCMGGITKESVYNFFGKPAVVATAKNATALTEKIIENKPSTPIVFFCGDQRLDDLPETLRFHQMPVEEVIVYNTLETPQQIEKNYQGIIFFSPSAVHSFFSINTVPTNVVLFSIGKTTTATIQTYCSNKVITSEWPGKEQMIELVVQYYS